MASLLDQALRSIQASTKKAFSSSVASLWLLLAKEIHGMEDTATKKSLIGIMGALPLLMDKAELAHKHNPAEEWNPPKDDGFGKCTMPIAEIFYHTFNIRDPEAQKFLTEGSGADEGKIREILDGKNPKNYWHGAPAIAALILNEQLAKKLRDFVGSTGSSYADDAYKAIMTDEKKIQAMI